MARPLLIDDRTMARIADVMAYAEANPISFEVLRNHAMAANTRVLNLKDRKPGLERPPSATLDIPFGFRASFSIEDQPSGICKHLSVSVDRPGRVPNQAAVEMIAEAFGMATPFDAVWMEEFEPGHHAVNVLTLAVPRTEGKA